MQEHSPTVLSGSRIEALGRRIREERLELHDDELITEFLISFEPFAYATYQRILRIRAAVPPYNTGVHHTTERAIKSLPSIREKLKRQHSLRLSQIQDIVGCRMVVEDRLRQDYYGKLLVAEFPTVTTTDRRANPTHGYRALHLIVREARMSYEIQIRTVLQHRWATLVETLMGRYGSEIKYGGGPTYVQDKLLALSNAIADYEALVEDRRQTIAQAGIHPQYWRDNDPEAAGSRDRISTLLRELEQC